MQYNQQAYWKACYGILISRSDLAGYGRDRSVDLNVTTAKFSFLSMFSVNVYILRSLFLAPTSPLGLLIVAIHQLVLLRPFSHQHMIASISWVTYVKKAYMQLQHPILFRIHDILFFIIENDAWETQYRTIFENSTLY